MSKKTLYSLDRSKYPNRDVECKDIPDIKTYATTFVEYLKEQGIEPQYAQKTVPVTAREGIVGEQVDTRPRANYDGQMYTIEETKNSVKVEGSKVVKNPDGEEYIVKPEAFDKKYTEISPGEYQPVSSPIKYVILQEDIVFPAPWGGEMLGLKGAALNITNLDDIYAIQNSAFESTYTPITPQKTQTTAKATTSTKTEEISK